MTVGMVCVCLETEGIVVVYEFFRMERSRGAVVTLVPSGDRGVDEVTPRKRGLS